MYFSNLCKSILLVSFLFCQIPKLFSQVKKSGQTIGSPKIYYGAAYYPEAWPEAMVDDDIARMKELSMNVMRIGEFAWSTMEPEEGKYNFGWLHKVIEKLNSNGIETILGTPSATPPVWMLEKYPEMLLTNELGQVKIPGGRRDCSYSNATYKQKTIEICERMGKEFGNKPGVIGWQTDNEFGFSPDYSKETEGLWHGWLKKEYGDIAKLNALWKTMIWSQTFSTFEQIPMPRNWRRDLKDGVWHHPSLIVAWQKFTNQQIENFEKIQEAALRKYTKLPITHDAMPGQMVDYEEVMSTCDFPAFNCYHGYRGYDLVPSNHDRQRGMKKGMHWLFETTPNFSGGDRTWFNHEPEGSEQAFIWMNHALGAQGSMFWLWKQQPGGQEMVHGALISAWNKPIANFASLKKLGADLKKASDFLISNPVSQAEIGLIYSHKAHGGLIAESYVGDLKYYQDWSKRIYVPVFNQGLHRDVIYPSADISGYKLLVVSMLPHLDESFKSRLKAWVENGGTLILGPMAAYRNKEYAAHTDAALGDLENWAGFNVEERVPISSIPVDPLIPSKINWVSFPGIESTAGLWTESLSSKKAKVLASYTSGWLSGKPAALENKVGKGKVVYLGADPGNEIFGKLVKSYASEIGIQPVADSNGGVIFAPRKGKNEGLVLVNLENTTKKISLPKAKWMNILTGEKTETENFSLQPYGTLVLQKEK